jgi:hypothetical protein
VCPTATKRTPVQNGRINHICGVQISHKKLKYTSYMLKMNFKLNPRNKPFDISTSTKKFPSTNYLQEYWSLYVPSKFMFSCHSNHKCGLGQKKVYIFDCPQQGTGRPEISNRLSKQSVQAGKGCHTSERSQSKSECIRW